MKRIIAMILLAGMTLSGHNLYSQGQKITLLHNGVSSFHTTLAAAQTAAVDGDTLYLPGGGVAATNISKRLTIVGAGFYPDSTTAIGATQIPGNLILSSGASGGSIIGVALTIHFPSMLTLTSYTIKRCSLNLSTVNGGYYPGNNTQNFLISECIITGNTEPFYLTMGSIHFEKNIFLTGVYYRAAATYNNNIFYQSSTMSGFSNSTFNNNIFIIGATTLSQSAVNACIFNNNLYCTTGASLTISNWGSLNFFNNNLFGELAVNTFINATTTAFSYANNYHLLPASPGVQYGTDQKDVGIYGTLVPYKDGALPFNPHISSKVIGSELSPTGNLSVDVKVTAQDR